MSGSVASRITGSWWQRLALVTWMLVGGQLVVSAAETTTTFVSTNVGLRIPVQPGGGAAAITNSTVQVSGIQTGITRVTVSLYITHRWPADMRITLIPPAGPIGQVGVLLVDDQDIQSSEVANPTNAFSAPYSNRASFNTGLGFNTLPAGRVSFSDDNLDIIPNIFYPNIEIDNITHVNNRENQVHLLPGTYNPAATLATFNTMAPSQSNGTWQLRIEDVFNGEDDGVLVYWSIGITEPGPHIWTGAGADDNWSTALNWQAGNVPTTGEPTSLLIFPATAVGPSINDIGEIRVVTMNVAGGYNFTATGAGSITLVANSTLSVSSGTAVNLNMPMALVEQPTITVTGAGGLNLLGNITNDGPAAGMILAAGTSPLTISGNNGYTGVTAISSGVIDISNSAALGGGGGAGTTVANGASLRVAAGLNLANETVSIQGTGVGGIGSLVFTNGATLNGLTLVAGIPGTINILAGVVTVNTVTAAAPAAVHTLSVTNAGTLAINGALPASTALNLSGGATTFGAIQDYISTLSLSNGADLNVGARTTMSGSISVGASAAPSIIDGTELNLGGGGRTINVGAGAAGVGGEINTTTSDLAISADITNGSFTKQGGGVLRITGDNTGVGATVSGGTLAGEGNIGPINVANGILSPSGTFAVGGGVNLASGSALILPAIASAINATGAVTLNGVAGTGGAVLQVYADAGLIIITGASVTGTFDGKPNGAGITYNLTTVELTASGGRTMAFTPAGPFVVNEEDGTLQVTVTASSPGTAPVLRVFGEIIEGRDVSLVATVPVGTFVFAIPISNNFVDTGDLTGTLVIVPQDGSLVSNSATLTIRDNDTSDAKSCGFGTGLTVFLLFGFGLLLHMRLRRS